MVKYLKEHKKPLLMFFSAKVLVVSLLFLAFFIRQPQILNKYKNLNADKITVDNILQTGYRQFDVWNYIVIAQNGYPEGNKMVDTPGYFEDGGEVPQRFFMDDRLYAFFPLLPLLLKLLSYIGIPFFYGGLIISFITSLGSILLLYDLLPEKYKDFGTSLLVFSPIMVYMTVGYTEGLFMFLSLLAYASYEKKNYFLTGLSLALLMLTRNMGVVITIVFAGKIFLTTYRKKEWRKFVTAAAPVLVLGLGYNIFLFLKKGDPLYFGTVTGKYWHRFIGLPIVTAFSNDIQKLLFTEHSHNWAFILTLFFNFLAVILFIYCVYALFKKKDWFLFWLLLLPGAIVLAQYSKYDVFASLGYNRYLLGLFPLYLILPSLIMDSKNTFVRVFTEFFWYGAAILLYILFISNMYTVMLVA